MDTTITFTVNGKPQIITTDPDRSLLDVLREDLKLTGTKYGCGEGQCRACTVLVNGEPIAACLTPVSEVKGRTLVTIEGLGSDTKLHPVQEAFLAEGAFQCGFCTAGMILESAFFLTKNAHPSEPEVAQALQKHICRCGTYPRIIKAVRRAAAA
jgi:aerobic-type carbon monoxide dehydrogenase small subunit (CoxS/CutS family)